MTLIETQKKVIKTFAELIINRLINKVVGKLQLQKIEHSGYYEGSIWDEFCHQVQEENLPLLPQHENIIKDLIESELHLLAYNEKMVIWFQTEDGQESIENEIFILEENEETSENQTQVFTQVEVVGYLYSRVLKIAEM